MLTLSLPSSRTSWIEFVVSLIWSDIIRQRMSVIVRQRAWIRATFRWNWEVRTLKAPLCKFNGHDGNMHQRHLTAEITELIARTSIVTPTGVSNCGSHTYTFMRWATDHLALSGHISILALFEVSSKHISLQFYSWTFWNLLRTLNLFLKCWTKPKSCYVYK